jgi:hypothetical protein
MVELGFSETARPLGFGFADGARQPDERRPSHSAFALCCAHQAAIASRVDS